MFIKQQHYFDLLDGKLKLPPTGNIILVDHLGGFDLDLRNQVLDKLTELQVTNNILTQYCISDDLRQRYNNLDLEHSRELQRIINFGHFQDYQIHPEINYTNFVCSFNGSDHIGRQLLTSILHKFKWFNSEYSSKNFSYSNDQIDDHIRNFVPDRETFYRKFFINEDQFGFTKYSFGYDRYNHKSNIHNLDQKLTQSFLHIISESVPTSYYPYVTEKFLYSVVTRGLFLAFAQPGWHQHLEKYYGFRLYRNLFDYTFDDIVNPIERLVMLMSSISKFSVLTPAEWKDLYCLEQDTIDYNHDRYFSGDYLK